ncbi:oxidoreductase [Salibacterium sp. K-3]
MDEKRWMHPLPLRNITLPSSVMMEVSETQDIDLYKYYAEREISLLLSNETDNHSLDHWEPTIQAVHDVQGTIILQLNSSRQYIEAASRETALHDIHQMIQSFADQAAEAERTGFDGVEILGTKGSGVYSFMSSEANERTGQWGGSREDRLHFPLAAARHIREYTGGDFPVLFRLPCAGIGIDEEEITEAAEQLEASGVDMLHIGSGRHGSSPESIHHNIYTALSIKQAVSLPVAVSFGNEAGEASLQQCEDTSLDGISLTHGNDAWKPLFLTKN